MNIDELKRLRTLIESAEDADEVSDEEWEVHKLLSDETSFKGPVSVALKKGYILPAAKIRLQNAVDVAKHFGLKLQWEEFDGQQHKFNMRYSAHFGGNDTKIWTFVIFGKDNAGNTWRLKKYEGNTRGGGQTWIYINKTKLKAADLGDFVDAISNPKPQPVRGGQYGIYSDLPLDKGLGFRDYQDFNRALAIAYIEPKIKTALKK